MADVVKQLEKLARYKEGFESETDEVMKAKYKGMIEKIEKEIAEAEKQVVKEEEKIEKKEEKAIDEVSEKIKKYTAIMDDSDDPEVKSMYQKRIEKLKTQIGEVKEQIKEEKKELQEKKDELKEAVLEVKDAKKSVRTQAIKKAEKTQVERKEISKAKKERRKRLRSILTDLNKLVSENDILRSKYQGKDIDLKRDAGRGSKPFGYRFKGKNNYRKPKSSQHGQPNVYYEARPNRADVKPKGSVKLEHGGMMAKGGKINMDRIIWESWTVGDFIRELEVEFRFHPKFKSKDEVKKWAMENQPYYKKYIPEVVNYYWEKNQRSEKMVYDEGGDIGKRISVWSTRRPIIREGDQYYKPCGVTIEMYDEGRDEWAVRDENGRLERYKTSILESIIKEDWEKAPKGSFGSGEMAKGGETPMTDGSVTSEAMAEGGNLSEKEKRERELEREMLEYDRLYRYGARGGMLADKYEYAKGEKVRQGYDDRKDESLAARRGKTASKDLKGTKKEKEKSRRDDAGFEKRKDTWSWKPEAIEKNLIPKSAMNKKPSAYYQKKYPNLVMLSK